MGYSLCAKTPALGAGETGSTPVNPLNKRRSLNVYLRKYTRWHSHLLIIDLYT